MEELDKWFSLKAKVFCLAPHKGQYRNDVHKIFEIDLDSSFCNFTRPQSYACFWEYPFQCGGYVSISRVISYIPWGFERNFTFDLNFPLRWMGGIHFLFRWNKGKSNAREEGREGTYACAEDSACTVCQDQNPPQFPWKRALGQSGEDCGALAILGRSQWGRA